MTTTTTITTISVVNFSPGPLLPPVGDDGGQAGQRAPGGDAGAVDGGDAPHPAPPRHRVQGPGAAAAGADPRVRPTPCATR